MDTQNSVVGECSTQNHSNDFKAGEFAQSPLVSPAATLGAATTHKQPLYSFAIRIYLMSGRSWIYNCVAISKNDAYDLAESSCSSVVSRFSVVWEEEYHHIEFKENFAYSQLAQQAIKKPDVSPVASLEAAKTHYYPALRNITTRELSFFLPDDSFTSVRDLAEFFPSLKGAELFLDTFRLAHPEFNYTHLSVVKSSISEPVQNFMQSQCWICPHCFNDEHHQSDVNGCEWQYKQDAIDAARYRFLRDITFNCASCSPSVHAVYMKEKWNRVFLNGVDLDDAIDKAMEAQS